METLYICIILIFIILITNYYWKTYEGFETKMYRLGDMIDVYNGPWNRHDKETKTYG